MFEDEKMQMLVLLLERNFKKRSSLFVATCQTRVFKVKFDTTAKRSRERITWFGFTEYAHLCSCLRT